MRWLENGDRGNGGGESGRDWPKGLRKMILPSNGLVFYPLRGVSSDHKAHLNGAVFIIIVKKECTMVDVLGVVPAGSLPVFRFTGWQLGVRGHGGIATTAVDDAA